MKKLLPLLLTLLLLSCAPHTKPYVWTYSIEDYTLGWLYDGPPLSIVVENPLDNPIWAVVACTSSSPYAPKWLVRVLAHSFVSALGQVMNKELRANPCWLESYRIE